MAAVAVAVIWLDVFQRTKVLADTEIPNVLSVVVHCFSALCQPDLLVVLRHWGYRIGITPYLGPS